MVLQQRTSSKQVQSMLDPQSSQLLIRVKSSGSSTYSNNCINPSKPQLSKTNDVSAREIQSQIIGKKRKNKVTDMGYPGYLTKSEFETYLLFREEVNLRGGNFRDCVFCFGNLEDETYACCRWLRARKFHLRDTIKMVEEATECRSKAAHHDFYPDPSDALGVEKSIYLAQYPQLYSGVSKQGCPVFISKPGVLNTTGLENITTLEGILNFHWWAMIHDFGDRLRSQAANDTGFKRFETVAIIDLENLSASQISRRALNIIKLKTEIDSLCFPETLNHMVVINAPSFFSLTWKMISTWVDERTAKKVEIISSRKKWKSRLKELIHIDQLPSDYGGKAQSTMQTIHEDMKYHEGSDLIRIFSKTISVRSSVTFDVQLKKGELMENIAVFTKSATGASFYISKKGKIMKCVSVVHDGQGLGDIERPTRVTLPGQYRGPSKFTVKVESKSNTFSSDNFLFLAKIKSHESPVIKSSHKESAACFEEEGLEIIPLNEQSSSENSSKESIGGRNERKYSRPVERELRDVSNTSQTNHRSVSSLGNGNSHKEELHNISQDEILMQQEVGDYLPWCCGGIECIKDILQQLSGL